MDDNIRDPIDAMELNIKNDNNEGNQTSLLLKSELKCPNCYSLQQLNDERNKM